MLAWRLSNTLDAGFCVEALDEALTRHGQPEIFNTDQGSQFTGFAFTGRLQAAGVRISMDGRGRCMDNIFIERLWRSLKYEAVYLHDLAGGFEAGSSSTSGSASTTPKGHTRHSMGKPQPRPTAATRLWI